jgi:hypothetical protein
MLATPIWASADADIPGEAWWARIEGTWRPAPGSSEAVAAAVHDATESMNVLTRGIARSRLLNRFTVPSWIRIEHQRGNLVIEFAGSPSQTLPLSGEEVRQNALRLRATVEQGVLHHSGTAPDGRRDNRFRPEESGGLTMETTVVSPNLPIPLHFTLYFVPGAPPASSDARTSRQTQP